MPERHCAGSASPADQLPLAIDRDAESLRPATVLRAKRAAAGEKIECFRAGKVLTRAS